MANKFKGLKCPKCGKKGLSYAPHPHAYGWKNYDKVACRYCGARFPASQIEAHLTMLAGDAATPSSAEIQSVVDGELKLEPWRSTPRP